MTLLSTYRELTARQELGLPYKSWVMPDGRRHVVVRGVNGYPFWRARTSRGGDGLGARTVVHVSRPECMVEWCGGEPRRLRVITWCDGSPATAEPVDPLESKPYRWCRQCTDRLFNAVEGDVVRAVDVAAFELLMKAVRRQGQHLEFLRLLGIDT